MIRLIFQEFLFFKNLKVVGLMLTFMLLCTLLISTLMNSQIYQFAFDSFEVQYLNAVGFDLKLFYVLTNVFVPTLIIYSFHVELSNGMFEKLQVLPVQYNQKYYAKLLAICVILASLGTIFSFFLVGKVFFYSHLGLDGYRIHIVLFNWIYIVSLITLIYYNLLLFIFFTLKSIWILIVFHLVNVFMLPFGDFYWLPINWANYSIEYLYSHFTKPYFFQIHPPIHFIYFLVLMLSTMYIVIKRLNHGK
ncbi:hypothetical protein [Aquirufa sp. TARAVU-A1A]